MLDFWVNLKEELENRDLKQKELAAAIGVNYNTLQSWISKKPTSGCRTSC